MRFTRMVILIATGGLLLLACGDKQDPLAPALLETPEVPTYPDPDFLRWAGEAPLLTDSASFRPVRGQASQLEIHFQTGGRFLRLLINTETLRWRPDGTAIAPGESIEIRATVVDPLRMIVTFEPPGLVFNPAQPAYLELSYDGATASYMERQSEIGLWAQHSPGEPWYRVTSTRDASTRQLTTQANLAGFTRYALAIGR